MDEDELREYYTLAFKSVNGVSDKSSFVENIVETSFEGETLQPVLDNIFDFLKKTGYSYIDNISVVSKDGEKTWRSHGTQS
jgi:hypothetical protein